MKSIAIFLLLAVSLSTFSCDDLEPAEQINGTPVVENPEPTDPNPVVPGQTVFGQPIIKNSELYDLLIRATQNTGDPMTDIVCINFVYPFIIKKYDSSMTAIATNTMYNDPQFYNYLNSLAPNQPISLSYPITTIDSNGELFSVDNNDELLDILKECSQDAVISYCSGNFSNPSAAPCFWRVPYSTTTDNTYAGAFFRVNSGGSLVLNYNGQEYPGNWIFLFVGNELHMNINIEGTSAVAQYWNIDRAIYSTPADVTIFDEPKDIHLEKYCGTTYEFVVGDPGPGNGIIFYDKGEYTDGWRYLEVSASDLPNAQWGCPDAIALTDGASENGVLNSVWVANYHDENASCSQGNGSVAARNALLWTSAGTDDWFLPSEQELLLLADYLESTGMGNFASDVYWTSTEQSTSMAKAVNLGDGTVTNQPKNSSSVRTRAIRHF